MITSRRPPPALPPRVALWLLVVGALVPCCGAGCPKFLDEYPANGRYLPEQPALVDVMMVVNNNAAEFRSMKADANISIPWFPNLRADFVLERPRRLRLRGSTRISGAEVDLGSNDDLFWFWIRRNDPPAVYYCAHEQFAASAARRLLPVEPSWLIDALGATTFDPNDRHQGPYPIPNGRLRVDSQIARDGASLRKVTILDEARGWILEQHLYNDANELLASSITSGHRRDPLSGVTLPRRMEIRWPANDFTMQIDLENVVINYLEGDTTDLWTMPEYEGSPPVDIGDPRIQFEAPRMPAHPPQQAFPAQPQPTATPARSGLGRFFRWN